MYGRGNYAPPPQFGQGLQRPMPPYMQQPAGHHPSAPHFQPGMSMPVMQQGGPPRGLEGGFPPRGPAYPHAPPGPPSMPHQGPPVSSSNTGQQFMHPSHSGGGPQLSYLAAHQDRQPPPPPPPSMGPRVPPPPFMQLPPPPQPPPTAAGSFPRANFESAKQQSADSQVPTIAPPPPPLPPSSPPKAPPPPCSPGKLSTPENTAARPTNQLGLDPISEHAVVSESSGNVTTYSHQSGGIPNPNEGEASKQSSLLDVPPPPPKPTDENIVRNIEVLCQFIAKNGPEFEEMARKNESGNPEFNFLVGGDPGTEASRAHAYFLWMKKKCCLENDLLKGQDPKDLSERLVDVEPSNLLPNTRATHSPTDSDVDMEDDITQSDKEHGVYNSTEDVGLVPLSAGNLCETQKHENDIVLQYSRDNSPALKSSPSVKFQVDAEKKPENSSGQLSNIHNPFRSIQNYSSDDSSDDGEPPEPRLDTVKATVDPPFDKSAAASSLGDINRDNINLVSNITSETGLVQSPPVCLERVLTKEQDDSLPILGSFQKLPTKASPKKYKIDNRDERSEGFDRHAVIDGKYASGISGIDSVSTYKDFEYKDEKNTTTAAKVDEFGRLMKEGASESESDDAHHLRRRGRRDRSRSRSRSPSDKRRRRSPRRSPRRRKEKRSRSRSWSPKRRRSRSRSPYRSGGDFRGEISRRGKVQTRECFDFLKGRCYRGAACRYMHHEADKNETSRRYDSNPDFHSRSVTSKSPQEHNGAKVEKSHLGDKHDNWELASQTCGETSKAETIDDAVQASVSHQNDEKLVTEVKLCAGSREGDQVPGASIEPISHPFTGMPPTNEHLVHLPEIVTSSGAYDGRDKDPKKMDDLSKTDSSTIHVSTACGVSVNVPYVNKMSKESTALNSAGPDFSHQVSHLPPPPLPQQATNALRGPNLQVDYNSSAPSYSAPPQSVSIESGHSYQGPLPSQQSHYSVPPNSAWSTLPQPRPSHMVGPPMPGAPMQFQQGSFPARNDFPGQMPLRPHPGELPSSMVGGFPHQTYHVPTSSNPPQQFGGQNLVRDDRYSQYPIQSSFVSGVAPQALPIQGDSTVKNSQSFPGDKNHQFAHPKLPAFGTQLTASESISHSGGSLSMPGYSANPHDSAKPSNLYDVGGSRFSSHYNPYASTFDQPLSTRFSSIAFTQERNAAAGIKYDGSFAPMDGQSAGDQGSRLIISSSNSSKAGRTLPKSSGDQYDPLFDSMDPYSELSKKHVQKQDHAADNSDIMLKLSSRHNVLDVEENSKQKLVGAVAAAASLDNEEFGETADAEVGAVENASPSNDNADTDIAEGDIEIDQVKPEGRSKKTKDSRSMKLFKSAVVEFVKDVLKPQWRQGNMSKEVYKTIVKKTVDKVSGAMKNHRVPKSQAKIDHYIDSSRRKLTQLVEGYVSKYKS